MAVGKRRLIIVDRQVVAVVAATKLDKKQNILENHTNPTALQALTSAALVLPGLLLSPAKAEEKQYC